MMNGFESDYALALALQHGLDEEADSKSHEDFIDISIVEDFAIALSCRTTRPNHESQMQNQTKPEQAITDEKDDPSAVPAQADQKGDESVAWAAAIQELHERDTEVEKILLEQSRADEKEGMATNVAGKAWNLVSAVVKVFNETMTTLQATPAATLASQVNLVAINEIAHQAENMLLKQIELKEHGKPATVDIGYHYTDKANMDRIRTEGLLSRPEREASNIQPSQYNGSSYGEGIYTGNDCKRFRDFGETGLIVARLKGEEMEVDAAGRDYTLGNNSIVSGQLLVLQQACQCLTLVKYTSALADMVTGTAVIESVAEKLQGVLDDFFNDDLKPRAEVIPSSRVKPRSKLNPPSRVHPLNPYITKKKVSSVASRQRITSSGTSLPTTTTRTLRYTAPDTLHDVDVASLFSSAVERAGSSQPCAIYQESLQTGRPVATLKPCRHEFNEGCALDGLGQSQNCPVHQFSLTEPVGKMPSGTMTISFRSDLNCAAMGSRGTIVVQYNIPAGTQKPYRENPGQAHGAAKRTAYIPHCSEGLRLLTRLEHAFMRGLTFTVGTSLTSGNPNQVTWASIRHKTSWSGGVHGFPDPYFFHNCNLELDRLGVPSGLCTISIPGLI